MMHAGFFFKKNLNINLMEKNMKLYNMQKLHYLVWIWKTITNYANETNWPHSEEASSERGQSVSLT